MHFFSRYCFCQWCQSCLVQIKLNELRHSLCLDRPGFGPKTKGHSQTTLTRRGMFPYKSKVIPPQMLIKGRYSMVPNNSAARLFNFQDFSLPTQLIWTYTLIKFQIIFLPTGWGISLRTVDVASKPVQPSPLSFAGFFIYVKRKFVANLKGISLLIWK